MKKLSQRYFTSEPGQNMFGLADLKVEIVPLILNRQEYRVDTIITTENFQRISFTGHIRMFLDKPGPIQPKPMEQLRILGTIEFKAILKKP